MAWNEVLWRGLKHLGLSDGRIDVRDISFSLIPFFLGWSIVLPIFSIRINDITGDPFVTGLIFSIWGFVCLALDIPFGVFSDKVNKKKLLQISMFLYILVTFLYTVIDNVPALVFLRIIHSITGCIFWISSWGVIRLYSTKKHRGTELGVYTSLRSFVEVVGPFIGAFLLSVFSWYMPFYVLSISCIVTFLMVSRLDIKSVEYKKDGMFRREIKDFFKGGRKVWGLLFGIIVIFSIAAGFGSFIPIVMDNLGFSYWEIGVVMSIGMTLPWAVFSIPVGIYMDKYGRVLSVIWGLTITALGFSIFHFSYDFISVLISTCVMNIGFTFCGLTLNTMVGDISSKEEYGGFTGLTEAPKDLSNIIGPIVTGFYFPIIGLGNTAIIFAAISMISIPIFYKMVK